MALEDIITNKYFVIALIIALIVVLFLYSQKKCRIEGMRNIELIKSGDMEKAWTEDCYGNYKFGNSKKNDYLKRRDELLEKYLDNEYQRISKKNNDFPMPMDDRPDLGNCQPCAPCPPCKSKKTDTADSESSISTYRSRKNKN